MPHVQCCFLIDATGSMARWLDAAKTQTRKIVADLRNDNPDLTLEVGAVFYRDFGDDGRFMDISFTQDVERFVQDIQPVVATGGDDTCEDVAGGFEHMLALNWEDADVKHLFFITDAPPHGRTWHAVHVDDRFPHLGAELNVLVEETVRRDIRLTIIKFTDSVIPMIERMERIYSDNEKHITVVNLEPQTPRYRGLAEVPPPLPYRYAPPLVEGFDGLPRSLLDTPEALLLTRTVSRMVSDSIQTHRASSQEDPLDL